MVTTSWVCPFDSLRDTRPNAPALLGPTRFCMPAMTLRSNHTISMVAISRKPKHTTTFSNVMRMTAVSMSPV